MILEGFYLLSSTVSISSKTAFAWLDAHGSTIGECSGCVALGKRRHPMNETFVITTWNRGL
jgi:hypothetical protein